MGKKSRAKGQRGQNEWKRYVNGEVLARAGYDGPDVKSPPMHITGIKWWEVKRRKALPKWFRDWIDQMEEQVAEIDPNEVPALAFREDGEEWYVIVPARHLQTRLDIDW